MAENLYIGLMSGTSLDGVDAALVRFDKTNIDVLASLCLTLPASLKEEIKSLIDPSSDEINRLMALDIQLGQLFAKAVNQIVDKAKVNKKNILAIGSHGQTIRHWPNNKYPSTLQIADPNTIAEVTGITTVADFRRRDMAAGGQGAPFAPAFHKHVFHDKKINRVILNLGGIANITIIAADTNKPVTGFDTGPANTLLNRWTQQQQNKSYDDNGDWGSSGEVNQDLLNVLLEDDFFTLLPPKSTGTEYFNADWLNKKLSNFTHLSAENIQASLTALTAKSIADAISLHAANTEEVILCGGGVHNRFLYQQLKDYLPNMSFNSTEKYGLNPDYIEAAAFAWLAKQTIEHKTGNLPDVTGASRAVVLGGVYYS